MFVGVKWSHIVIFKTMLLLRRNSHKVVVAHFECNMSLNYMLSNGIFCYVSLSKTFSYIPKKQLHIKLFSPIILFPNMLAITNVLSEPTDLPLLDMSYKWDHTMSGLL